MPFVKTGVWLLAGWLLFAWAIMSHAADATVGAVRINPKDGAEMVFVPAGPFLMGSADAEFQAVAAMRPAEWRREVFATEQPQRSVTLDGYWIYKREVTVAQYRKFCRETGRAMPDVGNNGAWKDSDAIGNVNWFDADAYAAWAGAALPTEAQWEKAARGTDGRRYPWGDAWDQTKCINPKSLQTLQPGDPVGASPYGALDMAGNLWEWCRDWYDPAYYATAPAVNPPGPATGTHKVLRGGSLNTWNGGVYFRCAYRDTASLPGYRVALFGFRCVVPAEEEK